MYWKTLSKVAIREQGNILGAYNIGTESGIPVANIIFLVVDVVAFL